MGITSLQVCMDSADWLQSGIHDDSSAMDSSSPSGDMLCSRPLIERRLRPPHDQILKCPRCDSTHTKFCYYNNYSLSQPRYFCKTCRRYWTKGGTLRNIPVGGGCRKNKKVSKKSSSNNDDHSSSLSNQSTLTAPSSHNPTDLHLSSFPPDLHFSHLNHILVNPNSVLESKYNMNGFLENPRPIDFMESKLEAIVGSARNNYDFMGNGDHLGIVNGIGEMTHGGLAVPPSGFHGLGSSPYGMSMDGTTNHGTNFMETCQRLMLTYDHSDDQNQIDVKPNAKLLSPEWQDQGCSDNGKETYGYINSMGPWSGMMNGYGTTSHNHLV